MSGKTIAQLTTAELREECRRYDLSHEGSKSDVLGRLEEYLRTTGVNPLNVRFSPETIGELSRTPARTGGTQNILQPSLPIPGNSVTIDNLPHDNDNDGQNIFQSTQNQDVDDLNRANNIFSNAVAQLGTLRRSPSAQPDNVSLESRISTLEASLTQFLNEQRQSAASVRRTLNDATNQHERYHEHQTYCSPPRVQDIRYTHNIPHARHVAGDLGFIRPPYNANNNRVGAVPDATLYTSDRYDDRTGHPAQPHTQTHMIYAPRYEERSVLIPYEDLRAARASLPEFSGTRTEDPVRFINNTESVLEQAHIHITGWCRAVEPQLKGSAATWWQSIKVLDLSWAEFRVEFLSNFDNDEIQLRLRTDILTTPQTQTQSLTEFVLAKNQLARRVNTGLSEAEIIHFITGLTRESFRTHIRLQRPSTFGELRRIASILDPVMTTTTDNPTPRRDNNSQPGRRGYQERYNSPPVTQPRANFNNRNPQASLPRANFSNRNPPGPCRHCGELHWHSECQHRATTSGNGGGAREN